MAGRKFFITTPIYYVNFKPHIGTSYTTILTDVTSRFRRMHDEQALLVTGSDEHSQNIADLASEAKLSPREYCDQMIPRFTDCWKLLEIQDYRFERTSDERHHRLVRRFWQQIYDKGDVYKGEYAGWYHTTDNRYLDEDEVPEKPEDNPRLKYLSEEAYYFKLSAYQDWLLAFHEANPSYVIPDFRRNEMLNRIRQGLRDTCISRTSTDWGIRLPWDEGHVLYVWVEALLTYLTGSGFDIDAFLATYRDGASTEVQTPLWATTREQLASQPPSNFWPADLHVMAKDIPWFHAVIWPAMLASFGAPPPKQMLVHGYWQFAGEKMSKSLGNVVDPYDAAKLVGVDGLRYFLMREVPAGRDGNFNYESLIKRYNYDLANDLGNLVHRTISMLHQSFDGAVPPPSSEADASLEETRKRAVGQALKAYAELRFSEALQHIWALVREANQYIDRNKPWEAKKKAERRAEIGGVFNQLIHAIRTVALLAYPVVPVAANRFWRILNLPATLEEQRLDALDATVPVGHKVCASEVVFKRVDEKVLASLEAKPAVQAAATKEEPNETDEGLITIDDFGRVSLRVALVKTAEKVPKADRLLKLIVDDGERERQIVAGIAQHYDPADLPGKRVVIVANLKPAKLRGLLSEGMLLAATNADGSLSIISPERDVEAGAGVR
jgi:methionyl-tRNA synthetase